MYQKTLKSPVEFAGIGTHSGEYCSVKIFPAPKNYGIRFFLGNDDEDRQITINPYAVSSTTCATTISNKFGDSVSTVEHLMFSLFVLGIFNAKIVVTNNEIPILDGSAKQIIDILLSGGIKTFRAVQPQLVVDRSVTISDGKRFLVIEPSDRLEFDVSYTLSSEKGLWTNEQEIIIAFDKDDFIKNVAYARTFGFFSDMGKLRSLGLIRGTSLENCIAIGIDGAILNDDGLRDPKEFIKHKLLDLVGDLAMFGVPVIAKIRGNGISHTLNNQLLKRVLLDQFNYHLESSKKESNVERPSNVNFPKKEAVSFV